VAGDLGLRLVAEALGTGLLVLFVAGSVVAALTVGGGRLDYAGERRSVISACVPSTDLTFLPRGLTERQEL
jgi:glycerol uptake facilitator-like aquaporin